jgi:restriction system protein
MLIPSQKDIQIPLLRLIHAMGGKVKPSDVFIRLANYFRLTEKELQEMQPSGVSRKFDNRVAWARNSLCIQGLLDRSVHGIRNMSITLKHLLSAFSVFSPHSMSLFSVC